MPSAGHWSLSANRERDKAVGLHLLGQGHQVVPRRGDGVALLREGALVVEDHPRVVVDRHEVIVAVGALAQRLHRVAEVPADLVPHVVDRLEQPLSREVLHPVPGEPGGEVVRRSLQVGRDVILKGVVVDGVNRDADAGRLLGVGHQGREGLLRRGVGVVGAEADGAAARTAGRRRTAAGGAARAGTAGGEGTRDGDQPGGRGQSPEGGSSAELKIFGGGCALHCHSLQVLPALSEPSAWLTRADRIISTQNTMLSRSAHTGLPSRYLGIHVRAEYAPLNPRQRRAEARILLVPEGSRTVNFGRS